MTHPGETVSDKSCHQNSTDVECEDDCSEKLQESKNGSDEMQSPVGPVRMLTHVERIELIKSFILFIGHELKMFMIKIIR